MSIGKIVIELQKESGKAFQVEHPFRAGSGNGKPSDEEMDAIGAGETYDAASTDTMQVSMNEEGTSLIGKLIAFHRQMHYATALNVTRIYVTDGIYQGPRPAGEPPTSVFWTANVLIPCLRGGQDLNQRVAPGSIVLRLVRNPEGFSARAGHLSLRGALLDEDVRFDTSGDLLGWAGAAESAAAVTHLNTVLGNTHIPAYYGAGRAGHEGSAVTVSLGIGRARGGTGKTPGTHYSDLVDVMPMSQLTVDQPRSRQATRGRRRKQS